MHFSLWPHPSTLRKSGSVTGWWCSPSSHGEEGWLRSTEKGFIPYQLVLQAWQGNTVLKTLRTCLCCSLGSYGDAMAMGCKYFILLCFQTYCFCLATSERATPVAGVESNIQVLKNVSRPLAPKFYYLILVWFGGQDENPANNQCEVQLTLYLQRTELSFSSCPTTAVSVGNFHGERSQC